MHKIAAIRALRLIDKFETSPLSLELRNEYQDLDVDTVTMAAVTAALSSKIEELIRKLRSKEGVIEVHIVESGRFVKNQPSEVDVLLDEDILSNELQFIMESSCRKVRVKRMSLFDSEGIKRLITM